jgi:CRISPR/Cas system-associated exonuclease Cas4 (RecB family)
MVAIPQPENTTAQAVVQWRARTTPGGHRAHLGASLIGAPCDRMLWYTFRWVAAESFEGRILRLFDTGKREEARVYEELRGIGCQVWADDGTGQYRVSAIGGFFGGSMDGVVQGLVEAPKAAHVLEIKTHSDKLFADLKKKGVQAAKPMHYAQMQAYMHLAEIDRGLYYAVNKNTDELYLERVTHDANEGKKILARAEKIIRADVPPMGVSTDPAYFECKWCKFYEVCHGTQVPEVNCRTCAHATPDIARGEWTCSKGLPLTDARQRKGCDAHLFIPPLLSKLGDATDSGPSRVIYMRNDGRSFTNGPAPGFSSHEIALAPDMVTDPTVQALKAAFTTARVVA